jgi:hypothetical protein
MSKQIELIKKWINDPSSVSKQELKDNASSAHLLGMAASREKDIAHAMSAACSRAAVTYPKDADFVQAWVDVYEKAAAKRIGWQK